MHVQRLHNPVQAVQSAPPSMVPMGLPPAQQQYQQQYHSSVQGAGAGAMPQHSAPGPDSELQLAAQ